MTALMAVIAYELYSDIPGDYEPRAVSTVGALLARMSLCSFVMATYTCYLLAVSISPLANWEDAFSIHQQSKAPWWLFQIGTTCLAAAAVFEAFFRFEWETAIALGGCLAGAQVAWWSYMCYLKNKVGKMKRIDTFIHH